MSYAELDAQRLARAVAGDQAELEALLRAVQPELRAWVVIPPLWRRSLEPDDVIQVSFLEAFLRISTLQEVSPAGFRAWMRRTVENNLTDAIRMLERDKRPDARRRVTQGGEGESARTLLAALRGGHPTPSRLLSADEEVARLHAAIAKLPATYRTVVREVDLAERPVTEVAQELGRSRGGVHVLLRRAHERLAELLSD
jgi:RNA polymerase sigma-70 factor (ECF subfamily)